MGDRNAMVFLGMCLVSLRRILAYGVLEPCSQVHDLYMSSKTCQKAPVDN